MAGPVKQQLTFMADLSTRLFAVGLQQHTQQRQGCYIM